MCVCVFKCVYLCVCVWVRMCTYKVSLWNAQYVVNDEESRCISVLGCGCGWVLVWVCYSAYLHMCVCLCVRFVCVCVSVCTCVCAHAHVCIQNKTTNHTISCDWQGGSQHKSIFTYIFGRTAEVDFIFFLVLAKHNIWWLTRWVNVPVRIFPRTFGGIANLIAPSIESLRRYRQSADLIGLFCRIYSADSWEFSLIRRRYSLFFLLSVGLRVLTPMLCSTC